MALREVQKALYFGIRESEAKLLILHALTAAGLKDVSGLVLFGGTETIYSLHRLQ